MHEVTREMLRLLRNGDRTDQSIVIALWKTVGCPDADGTDVALPDWAKESIDAYVRTGRPTGDFLFAVLSNDLTEAFGRADPASTAAMPAIVQYVYLHVPTKACGSRENVETWSARGGLEGLDRERELDDRREAEAAAQQMLEERRFGEDGERPDPPELD